MFLYSKDLKNIVPTTMLAYLVPYNNLVNLFLDSSYIQHQTSDSFFCSEEFSIQEQHNKSFRHLCWHFGYSWYIQLYTFVYG